MFPSIICIHIYIYIYISYIYIYTYIYIYIHTYIYCVLYGRCIILTICRPLCQSSLRTDCGKECRVVPATCYVVVTHSAVQVKSSSRCVYIVPQTKLMLHGTLCCMLYRVKLIVP